MGTEQNSRSGGRSASSGKTIKLGNLDFPSKKAVKRYLDDAVGVFSGGELVHDPELASVILELFERNYSGRYSADDVPQRVIARPETHPNNFAVVLSSGKIVPISHTMRRETNDRSLRQQSIDMKHRRRDGSPF